MSLTIEQVKEALKAQLDDISKSHNAKVDALEKQIAESQKGLATQEQYEKHAELNEELKASMLKLEETIKAQGLSLTDIINGNGKVSTKFKTLHEQLEADKSDLERIRANQTGFLTYALVNDKATGKMMAKPLSTAKDVSIHSTIDIDTEDDLLASVVNSMTAASILRSGNGAPILESYQNSNWLFDLVNYTVASKTTSFYRYWEELPTEGAPAVVPENGLKPQVQYRWELKSVDYKKVAAYLKITDEFDMDFPMLAQRAQTELRLDVGRQINNIVATDLLAQATAFVAPTAWVANVPFVNDYDAIMAMAAQVEMNTFSDSANVALMNSAKKWRISAEKDTTGNYLDKPSILDGVRFVGNPAFVADNIVVGDLKQYNLIMRGAFIVKIGYVDDDLIHNRFTVVGEQFFFNYIPTSRKGAIVKGTTFTAVKAAIGKSPS